MNILGLIPARGGSKAIPRKNIVSLGGRPLLAWTVDAAKQAKSLTGVLVSTDDVEIAAVARQCGAEVPFLRPAEFANDLAPALAVIQHALAWLDASGRGPDAVAYLQPTSPFRLPEDIEAAAALLREKKADTVVSVCEVPHQFTPNSLMRREPDGTLQPPAVQQFRRQDKEQLFARNGPAILLVRRETLLAGRLYGDRIMPLLMPALRSIDIDGPNDLRMAEAMLPLIQQTKA